MLVHNDPFKWTLFLYTYILSISIQVSRSLYSNQRLWYHLLDHEEEHQHWVKSNTQVRDTPYIHPKHEEERQHWAKSNIHMRETPHTHPKSLGDRCMDSSTYKCSGLHIYNQCGTLTHNWLIILNIYNNNMNIFYEQKQTSKLWKLNMVKLIKILCFCWWRWKWWRYFSVMK